MLKTSLCYDWPTRPSKQFNLSLSYTNRFSDAADVGNQEIKIDLGWRPIFQTSPYVLNFNFSLSLTKWKNLEITFPEKRRLRERKISVNLSNPNLSYSGLTPSAQYSFLDRNANIEMFRVRSHDVFIGLTNAFWSISHPCATLSGIYKTVGKLAGAEGLEPTTLGFGDRCSTN